MDQFPLMVYKAPGTEEIHGGRFATLTVHNEEEKEAALADGWHLTTPEAKAAHENSLKDEAKILPASLQSTAPTGETGSGSDNSSDIDNAPPTRAELEQKAKELGISFAANIGDKKLAEKIEEALKAKG